MKWLLILFMIIKPQDGFQQVFISSPADIVIGGGASGVGKSYALLMESLRNVNTKGFTAEIFRRTSVQVRQSGGLWDTSITLFPHAKGQSREQPLEWRFPSGAKISFSHLQHEKDKLEWQGSQICLIGFDELTHFSKTQFFYLLTRNRSTCGVRPYVRATCNPDPDSWVATFIEWWIDQTTGFPIAERAGKLRYFTVDSGEYVWGDTRDEVYEKAKHLFDIEAFKNSDIKDLIKSVTFIPGSIYDNQELLRVDPSYLANLMSQDEEIKAQLLEGNWKIKTDGLDLINFTSLNDSFHNTFVGLDDTGKVDKDLKRYISADIALHGSDKFVVFVWLGWRVIDVYVSSKTDPREVVNKIEEMATLHQVHRSNIIYDADGLGSYLKGYLAGARAFVNNGKPLGGENYENLKTQCAYYFAKIVNEGGLYIIPSVANYRYVDGKNNLTAKEAIINERRAVKRAKPDSDAKLKIIPKEQMKNIAGHSPDVIEALLFRAWFDVRKNNKIIDY